MYPKHANVEKTRRLGRNSTPHGYLAHTIA